MSDITKYLRKQRLPHILCPGCGHGIVMNALLRAIDRAGLDQDKTAVISGIGCSGRIPAYLDFNTLHTTHGRALAYATGLKLYRPDLTVIVLMGDGDASAIGGNHLIHAARRNIDLVAVVMNNSNYGMTSGQYSPLTPTARLTTTSPYGNIEQPFDLAQLVQAAGASYVARSTTYHVQSLITYLEKAIKKKGFAFVEAVAQCPTYFGRKNKLGAGAEMLERFKTLAVDVKRAATLSPEERKGKIVIGEFADRAVPEYTERYGELIARLKAKDAHAVAGE